MITSETEPALLCSSYSVHFLRRPLGVRARPARISSGVEIREGKES